MLQTKTAYITAGKSVSCCDNSHKSAVFATELQGCTTQSRYILFKGNNDNGQTAAVSKHHCGMITFCLPVRLHYSLITAIIQPWARITPKDTLQTGQTRRHTALEWYYLLSQYHTCKTQTGSNKSMVFFEKWKLPFSAATNRVKQNQKVATRRSTFGSGYINSLFVFSIHPLSPTMQPLPLSSDPSELRTGLGIPQSLHASTT